MKTREIGLFLIFVAAVVCLLVVGMVVPADPVLADLPRRPTYTPVPVSSDASESAGSVGGTIELRALFSAGWPWDEIHWQEPWTVVQWQDGWGKWHNADGWQGHLTEVEIMVDEQVVGSCVWWADESLGQGTFRWQVYRSKGGELLATSESFGLPAAKMPSVVVEVPLAP